MSLSKRRKIFETTTLSSKKHSNLISSHCFISFHIMSIILYIIFLDRIFGNFDVLFRPVNPKPSVKVTETYKLNWGISPNKKDSVGAGKTGFAIAMSPNPPQKKYITHIMQVDVFCSLPGHPKGGFKPLFFCFHLKKVIKFYPTHQKQTDVLNGKSP